MPRGRGIRRQRRQQHYPLRNRRGQVQRDNPQREVEQIAAEPEAVPHVLEVQLLEQEVNLPPTETLVFKGLLDLRNTEARVGIWRQIRHYINRCLYIVYFNVGVISVLDLLIN
jgi:hypothetical protein